MFGCVDLYLRRPREEITGEWPLIHCVMIGVEATGTNVKWVISWFVGGGGGPLSPAERTRTICCAQETDVSCRSI